MSTALSFALVVPLLTSTLGTKSPPKDPLTADAARHVFAEAAQISAYDSGQLWGISLYGPMMVVDADSRRAIANHPAESFQREDNLFIGSLPESIAIANTAFKWQGTRWTMLMWPLPEEQEARRRLIAHEMWHRIQPELGLPSSGASNLHLGTRDGRVWMQLEWRALAAALRERGDTRRDAAVDALAFRDKRHSLFPDAAAGERSLMMHEGLAEYTGVVLGSEFPDTRRKAATQALEAAPYSPTFVRSFAYTSGPAYGLLLDDLAPGWQSTISPDRDLPDLLADALSGLTSQTASGSLDRAVERYDGRTLMAAEDRIELSRRKALADMRRRFIEGPTLTLDFVQMNVEFDPGNVEALDTHGSVYPSMRLTDAWGRLTVTDGALIKSNWRSVVVPAPDDPTGATIRGSGYTLDVAEGWALVNGDRDGDYRLRRIEASALDQSEEVSFSTPDGVTIFGDYYAGRDTRAPLILLFHQGASNARAEYGPLAPRLLDAGYRLLAIDARRGGSRFGGENRTVAFLKGDPQFTYCDCYVDLVATLDHASRELGAEEVIAWGSSYSAALVFRLGVDYPNRVKAVLAFSPASGEPMAGCEPEPYARKIEIPVLILRPAREMELDHVAAQAAEFEEIGLPFFVADPAVHASSMLNAERVDGDVEPTWKRVLAFLQSLE